MKHRNENLNMIAAQMFRLLPIQILLSAVTAVNAIVSSFFANNFVGIDTMSAVGVYGSLSALITAFSTMLIAGSAILCGKYMGQNAQEKLQNVFNVDLLAAALLGVLFTLLSVIAAVFDLTGFLTQDPVIRPLFNQYLLGQSIGMIPLMIGNQFPAFLSMENRGKRTTVATLTYIVVNIFFNWLFVTQMHMEAFGLSLASSLGLWAFFIVQLQYYLTGKSHLRLFAVRPRIGETLEIAKVGFINALGGGYKTLRLLVINWTLQLYIGSAGVSAFATVDSLLRLAWAVPMGMAMVSRLMISVSVGEEDRQSLTDIMRVVFRRFVPLMALISAVIIALAVPLTHIFYRDPAEPVYMMTIWGLRLIPICMPLSVICNHFVCYGQASGKTGLVQLLSIQDGLLGCAGFAVLLAPLFGIHGVYLASFLNGLVTTAMIVGHSLIKRKRFPRNMEDLMVIPDDFGVNAHERMDLNVHSMEDVVMISERVQAFCRERGIDETRAFLSALSLEEMAGNIVTHGFVKDEKHHSVAVRVVHKDGGVILRLRDDCVPFDPKERQSLGGGDDVMKNIGIRMVYATANDVEYQNILGMNVLTVKI